MAQRVLSQEEVQEINLDTHKVVEIDESDLPQAKKKDGTSWIWYPVIIVLILAIVILAAPLFRGGNGLQLPKLNEGSSNSSLDTLPGISDQGTTGVGDLIFPEVPDGPGNSVVSGQEQAGPVVDMGNPGGSIAVRVPEGQSLDTQTLNTKQESDMNLADYGITRERALELMTSALNQLIASGWEDTEKPPREAYPEEVAILATFLDYADPSIAGGSVISLNDAYAKAVECINKTIEFVAEYNNSAGDNLTKKISYQKYSAEVATFYKFGQEQAGRTVDLKKVALVTLTPTAVPTRAPVAKYSYSEQQSSGRVNPTYRASAYMNAAGNAVCVALQPNGSTSCVGVVPTSKNGAIGSKCAPNAQWNSWCYSQFAKRGLSLPTGPTWSYAEQVVTAQKKEPTFENVADQARYITEVEMPNAASTGEQVGDAYGCGFVKTKKDGACVTEYWCPFMSWTPVNCD